MSDYIEPLLSLFYLAASVLFILGLRGLTSPETARRGMTMAAWGMALAIMGTFLIKDVTDYMPVIVGLIIGSIFGAIIAVYTPMTSMPERTAFSHACGALAVTLVGVTKFYQHGAEFDYVERFAVGFEVMFGALTVTGSIIAMGKLQGFVKGTPVTFPGQNAFNMGLFGLLFAMFMYLNIWPGNPYVFYSMAVLSLLFGVLLVLPIGAADMPVVISLLNSYAGLASCATGFALENNILIIGGALDGASGFILSVIMCNAMNRSIFNVLFGAFGQVSAEATPALKAPTSTEAAPALPYREIKTTKAVALFSQAKSVIIVPGYGMAVAQAQHTVRELADLLKAKGVSIKYAVHPVAGRMPGHMNVLLAEANVPYNELIDMEDINPDFPQCDVALVVGANDVTNPAARHDANSPIYGMPILDVDKAKNIIVIKRSMNPGFAGIDNELYYLPHNFMYFGDAKKALQALVEEFKAVEERGGVVTMEIEATNGVREIKAKQATDLFRQAKSVIIVPGYGMAVAQAQHGVRELADLLKANGCRVRYGVHPVAGRMPGHMNVLLAEANVPYNELIDMEDINPDFPQCDVALVVGANDVTNPAARHNPSSPIYGMPILDVDKAKNIIVIKRSMNPGFAGIDNELYTMPNTFMFFADAKGAMNSLVTQFKEG